MADEDPKSCEVFGGTEVEISSGGDFEVNTTGALAGDIHLKLADGRAVTIDIGGDPVFVVARTGSTVRIDLGIGANERLVLGDAFMALFNQFITVYNGHTHPCSAPGSPSGPPAAPGTPMTAQHLSASVKAQK